MALLGGYQPIRDINDPYVREIGEFAVTEHNKQTGESLVFVRAVSGEQQVVAGTNYKLVLEAKDAGATNTYEAVVYDKPWEKVRELTCFNLIPERIVKQVEVSSSLPASSSSFLCLVFSCVITQHYTTTVKFGGYQSINEDIKDPYVRAIGEFAVAEYNKETGKALVFIRVVSEERQVVAGTNYKLIIEADDAGATNKYEAVVYDKPWEKVRELTSFNPMPAVKQLGWHHPIEDIKDPYIQEIGEFAVAEHNKQTGQALVFVRVVSGEQQVVAGITYKITIEVKDAGVTKTYEAVVYVKPWEKVMELVSFKPMPDQQTDRPVKRGWCKYMCCSKA